MPVITRITGKNQVTVPAEIAAKAGLRMGSRLEWQVTDKPDVLQVRILPETSALAATVRGRGKPYAAPGRSAVDGLVEERERDEGGRNTP